MLFIELSMVLRPSGFIFKQWKKRFLLLTAEGSLLVCHDAASPPDQLVLLHSSCEAIVEGKEILDLPKLPSGGSRDCCFALILPQHKYLLLMADTAADCRSGGHCAFSVDYFTLIQSPGSYCVVSLVLNTPPPRCPVHCFNMESPYCTPHVHYLAQ
uniref:PH domain-containing protein n=1 Tax=Seriola lalandi dorsalis TaxID=1841481 RepID=A0A3B4Y029_SERLL